MTLPAAAVWAIEGERGPGPGDAPCACCQADTVVSIFSGVPFQFDPRWSVEIPGEFVERTLTGLGFKVEGSRKESWRVEVPSFRVDIDREARKGKLPSDHAPVWAAFSD